MQKDMDEPITPKKQKSTKNLYQRALFWIFYAITFYPLWWFWVAFWVIVLCLDKEARGFATNKTGIFVAFVVLLLSFATYSQINNIMQETARQQEKTAEEELERGRDYYLNVTTENSLVYDCEIDITSSMPRCKGQPFSGTFSNYDTVKLKCGQSDANVENNTFSCNAYGYISDGLYKTELYNADLLRNGIDTEITFSIYNNILREEVATKKVAVHYNLSDSDIEFITQKHETWLVEYQEYKRKMEEEAAEKKREQERKKQEEEEKKKQKEEEQKKQEEDKSSNQSNPSSNSSSSSSNSNQTYKWKQLESNGTCASNAKLCYVIDSSSGYSSYGYGTVKGRIVNNTGKNINYMQVTFDVYNGAGAKIGDCIDNIAGLPSSDTWAFEAYCTGWDSGSQLKNLDITWY